MKMHGESVQIAPAVAAPKTEAAKMGWFFLSGGIGSSLFFLLHELLWRAVWWDAYKGPFCWLVAYLCSIAWQMELHARLVFHTPVTNYLNTLMQAYAVYGVSIVVSTLMNLVLSDWMGVDHTVSFAIGLGVTGVMNYFFVSSIMNSQSSKERGKR